MYKGEDDFDIYGDVIPENDEHSNYSAPETVEQSHYNRTDRKEDTKLYQQQSTQNTQQYQQVQSYAGDPSITTTQYAQQSYFDDQPATNTICIENLNWWTTDTFMENLLCRFGKVVNLWFVEEKTNGKSKGICFCQFDSVDAARMARDNLINQDINGKQVLISYSSGVPQSRFAGPPTAFAGGERQGSSRGGGDKGGYSRAGGSSRREDGRRRDDGGSDYRDEKNEFNKRLRYEDRDDGHRRRGDSRDRHRDHGKSSRSHRH